MEFTLTYIALELFRYEGKMFEVRYSKNIYPKEINQLRCIVARKASVSSPRLSAK